MPPTTNKPKPRKTAQSKSQPMPERGPLYPAPGCVPASGMSEAELRLELAEHHGVPMVKSKNMNFTWLINQTTYERAKREVEAPGAFSADKVFNALAAIEKEAGATIDEVVNGDDTEVPVDDDDFSDLDFDDEAIDPTYAECMSCGSSMHKMEDCSSTPNALHTDEVVETPPLGLPARIVKRKADEDAYEPTLDPTAQFADEDDADLDGALDAMVNTPKTKPTPIFIGMPDTFDYMFDGHAGASPSGAERWAHCTASLEASRKFLETLTHNQQLQYAKSSTAARQGTTAHAVGEAELLLMLGKISQSEYDHTLLDLTVNPDVEEAYDTEMAEHLTEYVDYVRQLHDAGRPLLIEQRVRAKVWLTGSHDGQVHEVPGSGDCIALPTEDENVLTVADLKYGNGIDVTVDSNPQVRIYALGALALLVEANDGEMPELDHVEYVIVQPRLGGIKVWTESLDDLLDWRDNVLADALTKALYGEAEGATFSPAEAVCQWCPARGGCPALIEDRMAAGASMFDEVMEAEVSGNPIDPMALSNERLGEVLVQIMQVKDLHDDLKAEAQRRLHRGIHVPYFDLVNYTPPSSWKEGAEKKIEDAVANGTIPPIYKPRSIMTPKQARTLLKEQTDALDWLSEVIETHDIKPVVALDPERRKARGDKRKSWNGRPPESMFADETDEHDTPARAIEDMFPETEE